MYTSIPLNHSVEKDAEMLLNKGPRATILLEANLSDNEMLLIKNKIKELCKKRRWNNEIYHKVRLKLCFNNQIIQMTLEKNG